MEFITGKSSLFFFFNSAVLFINQSLKKKKKRPIPLFVTILSSPAFSLSLLPKCLVECLCQGMRNLDFTAVKNLHLFSWHCILKYHIRVWPSDFLRTTVAKSVGVFLYTKSHGLLSHRTNVHADQIIWGLAANLCSWVMGLQGRVPGVGQNWFWFED